MFKTGNKIIINLFGTSHGKHIGMDIEGLPIGYNLPLSKIKEELEKRKPDGFFSTSRIEKDEVEFIFGVEDNIVKESKITFIIPNKDIKSEDYEKGLLRPGHADLGAYIKYKDNYDYRGGGFFSGRMTACFSVLGAICKDILENYGVKIFSRILSIGEIKDIDINEIDLNEKYQKMTKEKLPVFTPIIKEKMIEELKKVKEQKDSLGGSIETYILNPMKGLGEPYFLSIESYISSLVFSLGGVKGISFGDSTDLYMKKGSYVNDEYYMEKSNILTKTNHNGGISGGISIGTPIIFRTYIKPTPSIGLTQKTVSLIEGEKEINIKGRHDTCIAIRIRPVIECLTAFALLDLLYMKKSFNEEKR